jgi:regulatory protein
MTISRSDFQQRIMKYCAEAERCSQDVLARLISWGMSPEEADIILTKLRTDKFLDDERYARSYVTEKWNLDKWGRIKIENALRQKKINDDLIADTINTIDDNEYLEALHEILRNKAREVKSENPSDDARRVMMYAQSRGFEEELVEAWIENNLLG